MSWEGKGDTGSMQESEEPDIGEARVDSLLRLYLHKDWKAIEINSYPSFLIVPVRLSHCLLLPAILRIPLSSKPISPSNNHLARELCPLDV